MQNESKLRALASKGDLAAAVFEDLRDYKKHVPSLDIRRQSARLRDKGVVHTMQELLSLYKKLQNAGIGKLVVSTDPTIPHRFHFKVKVQSVGETALDPEKPLYKPSGAKKAESMAILFSTHLRSGAKVQIVFRNKNEVRELIEQLSELV